MLQHVEHAPIGSCLRIARRIDQRSEPRMHHRTGTHRAWLQCADQGAAGEAIIAQRRCCVTHGHDLSVGRRIRIANDAVVAATDDLTFRGKNNGAHRHLACIFRSKRFGHRQAHQLVIRQGRHGRSLVEMLTGFRIE